MLENLTHGGLAENSTTDWTLDMPAHDLNWKGGKDHHWHSGCLDTLQPVTLT